MKNVVAIPSPSLITGKRRFTTQSDTHIVMMQTDRAVPRIWVGNISVDITNFNGPSEKAKNKRNSMMQPSIGQPVTFIIKQIPVRARAMAADKEPTRYKGRRPQLSTLKTAMKVNNMLAEPKITWYNKASAVTMPADFIIVGP